MTISSPVPRSTYVIRGKPQRKTIGDRTAPVTCRAPITERGLTRHPFYVETAHSLRLGPRLHCNNDGRGRHRDAVGPEDTPTSASSPAAPGSNQFKVAVNLPLITKDPVTVERSARGLQVC